MGIFAQNGKPLFNGSATLQPGTLSAALFTPIAACWTDLYTISITTNETATRQVTLSDGTTSISYFVGGNAAGANAPALDDTTTPIRFGKGATISASVSAVTASKAIAINIRGLVSQT